MTLQELAAGEVASGAPSCILRVEKPGTDPVVVAAAGTISLAAPRPVAPTDAFRIASVTKPFTATVVLQLASEKVLTLDQAMVELLPRDLGALVDRVHVLNGVSNGHAITVRQLLAHASGLFDYATSAEFIAALIADPARRWDPRELVEGAVRWGEPYFPPGQGYGYAYSDTGYVLLGLIIEHLTGHSLNDEYRRRVLDPVGLADTYLEGYEPHRGPTLTHAYEGEFDAMVIDGTADWAGGGLVSTAADLARFAAALLDGQLLPPDRLAEMTDWGFRTLDPARHPTGWLGYGLGLDARRSHGLVLHGHRGYWGVVMHRHVPTGLTITGTVNQSALAPHALMDAIVGSALPLSGGA